MSIADEVAVAHRLLRDGNAEGAAIACRQVLRADPAHTPAIVLMAKIARQSGEHTTAERLLHHAMLDAKGLGNGDVWFQLALVLAAQLRMKEAAQAYYQVTLIDPKGSIPWINLTSLNVDLDEWREAEYCARQAIACDPKSIPALINLGEVLRGRGKLEGTIACLDQALRLNPQSALAHWNLALARLACGDFERGWEHYEWREQANQVSIDPYSQPRWTGQDLAGQCLMVHGEQGLGDEILFASCFDDLFKLDGRFTLVCEPRLAPLFRRSFPAATVVGFQRRKDRQPASPEASIDLQIPSGSLPRLFRKRAEDFPSRRRFLVPDPALVLRWRERLNGLGPTLKVGISWRAGGKVSEQRKRTTQLDLWQTLLLAPGVSWINLQYGDTESERQWSQGVLGVTIHDWPEGDPLVDIDSFSARMAALDLVICVDNSTAHLGGALGVETWVLLPTVPDWRWGRESDRSLWYPSLRLIRQSIAGQWNPLFRRLADDLRSRSGASVNSETNVGAHANQPRVRAAALPPAVSLLASDVKVAMREAQSHFDGGRQDRAESICRQVLALNPRQMQALHLLSRIALATDRVQLAIDSLRRAVSQEQRPDFYLELAGILTTIDRRDEAIIELERAVAVDPRYLPAWHALDNLTSAAPRLVQHSAPVDFPVTLQ